MRILLATRLALAALPAGAADWAGIGADTEAKYYVDISSMEVQGDTVHVQPNTHGSISCAATGGGRERAISMFACRASPGAIFG